MNIQLEELTWSRRRRTLKLPCGVFQRPWRGGTAPVDGHQPGGALRCPGGKLEFPSTMRDVPSVKGILRLSNVVVGRLHERPGASGPGAGGHRPYELTGSSPVDWELAAYGAGFGPAGGTV